MRGTSSARASRSRPATSCSSHRGAAPDDGAPAGRVAALGPGCRRFREGDRVGVGWIHSSDGSLAENIHAAFVATGRDVDGAVNDVRDRVSAILGDLPDEADPPEIQKVDSNNDVIMWLNLVSDRMTVPALTDYADRYLVDLFSVLDGVARVRIGGGQNYAMRIWLDRNAMAARGLVVSDVEDALRAEFRYTWRAIEQGDFLEGIRAQIIDKDRAPRWTHARLEDVTGAEVDAMLAPLGADDLTFDGEEQE